MRSNDESSIWRNHQMSWWLNSRILIMTQMCRQWINDQTKVHISCYSQNYGELVDFLIFWYFDILAFSFVFSWMQSIWFIVAVHAHVLIRIGTVATQKKWNWTTQFLNCCPMEVSARKLCVRNAFFPARCHWRNL